MDRIRYVLALLSVSSGIGAFYFWSVWPLWARAGAVVAGVVGAVLLLWKTALGDQFLAFATASYAEVRKVVWPTRRETVQATAVVFIFVVLLALLIWVMDKVLEWIFYGLVLGWA